MLSQISNLKKIAFNMCKLGKKSDNISIIITFLLQYGLIYFENFIPYLKLNTHYEQISDENMLYAVIRRHIEPGDRYKVNNRELKEVVECIQDDDALQISLEESKEKNKYFINLANGVYDIMGKKLLPHDISYKFDYCLSFSYIPAKKRTLEEYNYFIDTSIGKENEDSILITIGLAASSIKDTKKLILIIGSGDSGKSKICDIISRGVGAEYVVTNAVHKLGSEKAIASYSGNKRVNLSRDTTIGVINEDAGFKSVISNEQINGRLLYHNEISVTPRVTCIAASNGFPRFKNADDATLNRIVPIKIKGYKGKPDPKFSERLLSETDSICSLAVDRLKEFVESDYDFRVSQESIELLAHEKDKLHTAESFINDCCIIKQDYSVSSVELYNSYKHWCENNAFDPTGKNKFYDAVKMAVNGAVYKKVPYGNTFVNGFYGLRLKTYNDHNVCNDVGNKISNGNDKEEK